MEVTLPCLYCGTPAMLKEDGMVIRKGLVKVNIKASNYQCPNCNRSFTTKEQNLETSQSLHPHRAKLAEEGDKRRGIMRKS